MKHQSPQDPATSLKELKIKPAGSGFTWDHLGLGLGTGFPIILMYHHHWRLFSTNPLILPPVSRSDNVFHVNLWHVSFPLLVLPPVGPRVWIKHLLHVQPWESSPGVGKREVLPGPRQCAPPRSSLRTSPSPAGVGLAPGAQAGTPRAPGLPLSRSSVSPAQPWHRDAAALASRGERA